MELYKRYRPKTFASVFGQEDVIKSLKGYFKKGKKLPDFLLFTGPTGCGKTTLARIVARKLKCGKSDLSEINSADFRGIDTVRNIRERINFKAISGDSRVWIIDECHQMTTQAQEAFLKMLEEPPPHVWFILCTTDPHRLIATVRNRATTFKLSLLSPDELHDLLSHVADKIDLELEEDVTDAIVSAAEGSARKALVILDSVANQESVEEQLAVIESASVEHKAIEIARTLMNPRVRWGDIKPILESVQEDPESIRYMILGYFSKVLLGGGKMAHRSYMIIQAFSEPFYDTQRAGLIAACWEVVHVSSEK